MKWCLDASEDSSKLLDIKSESTKNYIYDIFILLQKCYWCSEVWDNQSGKNSFNTLCFLISHLVSLTFQTGAASSPQPHPSPNPTGKMKSSVWYRPQSWSIHHLVLSFPFLALLILLFIDFHWFTFIVN